MDRRAAFDKFLQRSLADLMSAPAERCLRCPECASVLWRGPSMWGCYRHHGRLIEPDALASKLMCEPGAVQDMEAAQLLRAVYRDQRQEVESIFATERR